MADDRKCCLCALSFGLAVGIVWGLGVLFVGLLATYAGIGAEFIAVVSPFYLGYEATLLGSAIGAAWGFVDGFIGGVVFAWIYNWFCCRCLSAK